MQLCLQCSRTELLCRAETYMYKKRMLLYICTCIKLRSRPQRYTDLEHVGVETSSNFLESEITKTRQLVERSSHGDVGGTAWPRSPFRTRANSNLNFSFRLHYQLFLPRPVITPNSLTSRLEKLSIVWPNTFSFERFVN